MNASIAEISTVTKIVTTFYVHTVMLVHHSASDTTYWPAPQQCIILVLSPSGAVRPRAGVWMRPNAHPEMAPSQPNSASMGPSHPTDVVAVLGYCSCQCWPSDSLWHVCDMLASRFHRPNGGLGLLCEANNVTSYHLP